MRVLLCACACVCVCGLIRAYVLYVSALLLGSIDGTIENTGMY